MQHDLHHDFACCGSWTGHTLHLQASACASCKASKLFCARLAGRMQAFYYVTTYDLYNFMKNFSRATHSTNHAGWPWFLLLYIWSIVSSYPAGPVIDNCWEVRKHNTTFRPVTMGDGQNTWYHYNPLQMTWIDAKYFLHKDLKCYQSALKYACSLQLLIVLASLSWGLWYCEGSLLVSLCRTTYQATE